MEVFFQALVNGMLRSGLYALTSIGLALSVGVLKIVNFAHGEFLMLGAYLGVFLFVFFGVDPLLSLPLAALALFALGAAVYRCTIRHVLGAPEINQMLLTFGISVFIQNMALILWTGDPRAINCVYRSVTLHLGGVNAGMGRFITFTIAFLMIVVLYLVLTRTRTGKAMRAVSQSRDGAGLVGIRVQKVYLYTFGLSAALAGMAGVMLSMVLYAQPAVGLEFTLKAFCIVVMAGLGNIGGVIWASLLLGVAESLVGTYLPHGSGWSEGVFFILILAVLVFRSRGVGQWFAQ
ncbi:MAG: branched-chain amino acid ABC transporter permease [Peptococcaceae bacterium]|nr:branched-chain amino acid ABC transporter permease [Peptococcaceae bacterium]